MKPSRAYSIYENDETDKKLFLKVITHIDDPTEVEKLVNVLPYLYRIGLESKENYVKRLELSTGKLPYLIFLLK